MRKFLALVLSLTTILCFMIPANALGAGDVIYLVVEDLPLASIGVYFTKNSTEAIPSDGLTESGTDGVYTVVIPEDATHVYFMDKVALDYLGADAPYALAECQGNALDAATGLWFTYGSAIEEETTVMSSTTNAVDADSGSGYTDATGQNSATINVSGLVGAGSDPADVVSVDIAWEAMQFTYTPASEGTWNPTNHTYGDDGTPAAWTSTSNGITVTNHSNVGITASFGFASAASLGITGEFRNANQSAVTSISLATADNGQNGQAGTATTGTVTFHVTGGSITQNTQSLGTITVTISKQP